jgi:flagellar biosynthesis protein FlhG
METQTSTLRLVATLPNFKLGRTTVELARQMGEFRLPTGSRTVAITSGKGGVGKTNVAVNLSTALAAQRHRVSLMDADLGLANADVLMGLSPQWHIGHVLAGQRTIQDITIATTGGVRLIPGGSGNTDLANLTSNQNRQLVAELRAVEDDSDFIVVDTAAGIAGNVTGVLAAASETIVVSTPDPASVIDAYAIIKLLHHQSPVKPIWIVINNALDEKDAEQAFAQIHTAAARFLNRNVQHLGTIPHDPELGRAVRAQVPVVEYSPRAVSSRAFQLMARFLEQSRSRRATRTDVRTFWELLTNGLA